MDGLALSEPVIRLVAFLLIFVSLAAVELWSPRLERPEMAGALKSKRWLTNLATVLISSAVLRVVFPAAAVGAAAWAEARDWGLFRWAGVEPVVAGIVSFVLLDFSIWLEHVASHKLPILWRIHRVHHADTGFDVTTGLRFHPLEILLSMLWKATIVIALGAPVISVLVFEVVLNGTSMFSHSNICLAPRLDFSHAAYPSYPGHASRPPFLGPPRNQFQLWFQFPVLGSPVRHLHSATEKRPRWY